MPFPLGAVSVPAVRNDDCGADTEHLRVVTTAWALVSGRRRGCFHNQGHSGTTDRYAGLTPSDQDAHVFVGQHGGPLEYSGFRQRVWEPACRRVGLPGLGFHDLRRTNATVMVRSGVDVKTAQARLGHSDPRMTLSVYAQATTEADRTAAKRLGALLMRPPKPPKRRGLAR